MHSVFARGFLPLAMLGSVASFWYAYATGRDLQLAVIVPAAAILLVAMAAERRVPYRKDWAKGQGDTATDLLSTAVLFTLVDPMLKWLGPVVVTGLLAGTAFSGMVTIFPSHWPFALQIAIAALLAEFASYWAHRLHHEHPALWWLHALHHGSERLYALNNFRIHPLNYAINYVFGIVPLLLIGTPQEVILGYFAVTYPVLMLQHANLPLQSGWFNYVFSTNEVHRWHHSRCAGEGDSNFGRALVLWDQVFGTFRYAPAGNDPAGVGLYVGSHYPARASFLAQLSSMFLPTCCRSAA